MELRDVLNTKYDAASSVRILQLMLGANLEPKLAGQEGGATIDAGI